MSFGQWVDDFLAVPIRVKEILKKMADESAVIQQIADALNDSVFPSITELIAEDGRKAARIAELEAQIAGSEAVEVAESEAAANARQATDRVAALFAAPELPDVERIENPE